MLPLPAARFVYGPWKLGATVNIDYHVDYDGHYYSVLFGLLREKFDVRATAMMVEIFQRGERITSHVRSYVRGQHTTKPEHMPKSHLRHLEWSLSRIIQWANTNGPQTAALCEAIMKERRHPEQGYRSCLGILRLGSATAPAGSSMGCSCPESRMRSFRGRLVFANGASALPAMGAMETQRSGVQKAIRPVSSSGPLLVRYYDRTK